jgi:hypothetical protein
MNVSHRTKGTIALVAALPVLLLAGQTAGASPPSLGVVIGGASQSHALVAPDQILPNSNLTRSRTGKVIFVPRQLSTTWSAPTSQACTPDLQEVTVTNKSGQSQDLLYQGQLLETLPKASSTGLCFFGSGTFAFQFHIDGWPSTLTVNVS